ncbi:hypothetical protein CPB86DRAFT_789576 [Serendipita vermifera]|nr:hypothetical protein CPB86DRAFT_789576 [Serendipita vermifera]
MSSSTNAITLALPVSSSTAPKSQSTHPEHTTSPSHTKQKKKNSWRAFITKLVHRSDESVPASKSKRASSPSSHGDKRGVHDLVAVKKEKKEENPLVGRPGGPMPGVRMTFV